MTRFSISINFELLFCKNIHRKECKFLVCLNSICTAVCVNKHNFLLARPLRVSKNCAHLHTLLNIGRHYMISSAIRKIEKRKQFVRTYIWKFSSAYGVNIFSVNLDREITFLTLLQRLERISLPTKTHGPQLNNISLHDALAQRQTNGRFLPGNPELVEHATSLSWYRQTYRSTRCRIEYSDVCNRMHQHHRLSTPRKVCSMQTDDLNLNEF